MRKILSLLIFVFFINCLNSYSQQISVTDLQTELLTNPIGIADLQPSFSWKLKSKVPNTLQTAYEICVSTDLSQLEKKTVFSEVVKNNHIVWYSGVVESSQSLHVKYAGVPLCSNQRYYWKVRVWDNRGISSNWSSIAYWQMGLLQPNDWKAQWIGLDVNYTEPKDDRRKLPARMLRKEFLLEKSIASATVHFCGLGLSELYVNGSKVSTTIMNPTPSYYKNRMLYVSYDVTNQLKTGANAVGALLGNGRFFAPRILTPVETPNFGFPKMIFQLHIRYADGSSKIIVSDNSWRITDQGPIRANSEFDGEEYDANMELNGWNKVGFDDSKWLQAQLVQSPGGKLEPQKQEPMRAIEKLNPISIKLLKNGNYLVDFGQSLYGMCQLKVVGTKNTKVSIKTSFDLDSLGNITMANNRSALSTDTYILKGNWLEVWAPRFRGQGFRYAEVAGWPGKLKKSNIQFLVVHSDLKKVGSFSCSNPLVNNIYENMLRSVRMQERGLPLDPDRDERQPWLSTSDMTSETESYMFQTSLFYTNFLNETRMDQREDGCISDAGSFWHWAYTKDPCWPSIVTSVPWSNYYFYANPDILKNNYEMMKKWVLFLEKNLDSDHIYRQATYSDWVDVFTMDEKVATPFGATSKELLATAYYYNNLNLCQKTASFLNNSVDEKYFSEAKTKVKTAFNKAFLDSITGMYQSDTQAAYALALEFDLVPEKMRVKVANQLVRNIMDKNNGHLTVGTIGIKWLMQALTHIGRTDVAYTILTKTTRPSWGYMIKKGATSIWERWDTDTQSPGMNGQSQTILAGYLGAWMYQSLAGIAYDTNQPGFKHIIMRPEPVGDLKWVNASFNSLYGEIKSKWQLNEGVFTWNVTVPPNCTATIYIPTVNANSIKFSNNKTVEINFIGTEKNVAVYRISSGNYKLTAQLKNIN